MLNAIFEGVNVPLFHSIVTPVGVSTVHLSIWSHREGMKNESGIVWPCCTAQIGNMMQARTDLNLRHL